MNMLKLNHSQQVNNNMCINQNGYRQSKGGGGVQWLQLHSLLEVRTPLFLLVNWGTAPPFGKVRTFSFLFFSFLLDSQGGGPELESVCFFSFLLFKPPLLFPKSFVWAWPGKICRFLSLVVWGLINCLHHASYRASSAKNNQKHANLLSRVIYINLFRSLSCMQFH